MQPVSPNIIKFLGRHKVKSGSDKSQLITLMRATSEIPWGEGRTIEEVLEVKLVGTCTGKHLVLGACFDALNIPHRTVVCTFRWSEQNIALPEHLLSILREGEWGHGHNFLQIQSPGGSWIDIDITWDPALHPFGFLTFPQDWDGETSFLGLRNIHERTDNADLSMKKQWLASLPPEIQERRERFLKEFFEWIANLRMQPQTKH